MCSSTEGERTGWPDEYARSKPAVPHDCAGLSGLQHLLPDRTKNHGAGAARRIYPHTSIGWEYYDGNFPLFQPDPPLAPEELQRALRQIMGRFYRFSSMFAVAGNVLLFPAMLFSLWNIRFGWRKWCRGWRRPSKARRLSAESSGAIRGLNPTVS
jgi:hypothetical protein